MTNTIQTIKAAVYREAKTVPTKWGERIVVNAKLPNGEEVAMWGKAGDVQLSKLEVGQSIEIAKEKKNWKLVSVFAFPQTQTQPDPIQEMPIPDFMKTKSEKKDHLKAEIEKDAKLLRYCFKVSQKIFEANTLPDTALMKAAEILFAQATQKV